MKSIITCNVCGFTGSRWIDFYNFVTDMSPDVVCVQDTKAGEAWVVNEPSLHKFKYAAPYNTNTSRGGIATYSNDESLHTIKSVDKPEYLFMLDEGRFLMHEFSSFFLINVYLPDTKDKANLFKKRLSFEWLTQCCLEYEKRKPVIICGDFNSGRYYLVSVGKAEDRYRAGFRAEEKKLFKDFKASGYVDALLHMYPDEACLIDYLTNVKNRPDVTRWHTMDYILVSNRLVERIKSVNILTEYHFDTTTKHLPLLMKIDI